MEYPLTKKEDLDGVEEHTINRSEISCSRALLEAPYHDLEKEPFIINTSAATSLNSVQSFTSKSARPLRAIRRASCQIKNVFVGLHAVSKRRLSMQTGKSVKQKERPSELSHIRYRSYSFTDLSTLHLSAKLGNKYDLYKKTVTWSRSTQSVIEGQWSGPDFEVGDKKWETECNRNMMKHEFLKTATITGAEAEILASEVRHRRGTVFRHANGKTHGFDESEENLLQKDCPQNVEAISHSGSVTSTAIRGVKPLRREISKIVLDHGGDYRVSQKLSKHGKSYLGTLRGRDLEMAKQLSEHTRLVDKKGRNQVSFKDMEEQNALYMKDVFTSMVDAHWYYVLIAFFASFFGLWLLFGLIYWAIAWKNGDIRNATNDNETGIEHHYCVDSVFDFTTAFLFALEGQTTIGYGSRSTTEHCIHAIVIQFFQFLTAIALDSLVVTIVFTKLARPKNRAKTVQFSKQAVICERDGELCLIVRAVNLRSSLLIDVSVTGKLLKTRRSLDGEWLALEERNVEFKNSRVLFLTQPVDYVHVIDKDSPLYELSKGVLQGDEPLELIVIMAGIVEGTGMACQIRTSYVCTEILWGHRFVPAISKDPKFGGYQVDYNKIDKTYEITPEMLGQSAEERDNHDEFKCEESELQEEANEQSYINTVKTIC